MKTFSYLGFAVLCIALLYAATFLFESEESVIGHEATDPDLYLGNVKTYALEHAYDRSLMHLDEAINAIRQIEQDLDPKSRQNIEAAVDKLQLVYHEIAHDSLQLDDLNDAFISALNALTYAEIKVSEHYIESHELDKAKVALKYGKLHIKNALKYATGDIRDYEVGIYEEIDSLIENKELSDEEIIAHLEHMLSELDTQ